METINTSVLAVRIKTFLPTNEDRAAFVSAAFFRTPKILTISNGVFCRAEVSNIRELCKSDRVRLCFGIFVRNLESQIYQIKVGVPQTFDVEVQQALQNRYELASLDYGAYSALKSLYKVSGYRTWPVVISKDIAVDIDDILEIGKHAIEAFRLLQGGKI